MLPSSPSSEVAASHVPTQPNLLLPCQGGYRWHVNRFARSLALYKEKIFSHQIPYRQRFLLSFDWRRGALQSYLEFKWFKFSTFLLLLCPQGNYFQDTTWRRRRRQRSLKHNFSVVCIVFLLLLRVRFASSNVARASFKVEQREKNESISPRETVS